jgi:hypothetical protein
MDPVRIQVIKSFSIEPAIEVNQNEGRAGCEIEGPPSSRQTLHQGRLPGTQIANQADHIPSLKKCPQPHADPPGMVSPAADKFHREGI